MKLKWVLHEMKMGSPMLVAYQEKPTVILYTYDIIRHAGTLKQRQKHNMDIDVTHVM